MEKHNSTMLPPRRHRSGAEYPTSGQLMVAPSSSSAITPHSSRFKLPPGWGIEQVLRSSGDRVDRYYYEPGTGQKFRSLRDVERRLNGEIFAPRIRTSGVRNYPKASLRIEYFTKI
uniref:Methyl binding domain protein n=1 Tax=Solanum tuberosum TaxID=4113 RepID=M1B9D9_SOLTU